MNPRAVVFDAYGTLFDVHSVVQGIGGDHDVGSQALSALWRQKQLEYTWLRSLMGRYADFWEITHDALLAAVRQLKIEASSAQISGLMQAYLVPSAFSDVRTAVERLKGTPLAILSNGSPRILESAVRHNGLEACFAAVISVDRVKTYKPSPLVYALGPEILQLPAKEILFVSSNSWDAAGAKAYGYRVCWCNRSAAEMEKLGFTPDTTVSSLDEIALGNGG